MGLIETASSNSVWRGMDYYKNKKVVSWKTLENGVYEGIVSGSEGNLYTVHIDTGHPRKSFCNCPFAEGRRADDFSEVRKIVSAGATSKPVKDYELTRYVNFV